MNPLEIIAGIFAVIVLIKIIVIFISPISWMSFAVKLIKYKFIFSLVYFIIALVVGYYIAISLDITQIAAVMFFTIVLIGLSILPYYNKLFISQIKNIKKRKQILEKFWFSILIWGAIAIVVLYKLAL